MKKFRDESFSNRATSVLNTPVGTFYGEDILEGFAADAEHLGQLNEDIATFDNNFYKLCKLDNYYIFEFNGESQINIPPMNMTQLDYILNTKMKLGKAVGVSVSPLCNMRL